MSKHIKKVIKNSSCLLCPSCLKKEKAGSVPFLNYVGYGWVCPLCGKDFSLDFKTGELKDSNVTFLGLNLELNLGL